jgi:ribulose bisphosphate carboxylase small subunit
MGSVSYTQAIRPDTAQIRKLVENSLLFDWVIRIEYTNRTTGSIPWEQWGKPCFALRSADSVIASIKSCYTNNPGYAIRLTAEKVQPRTRMIYSVYNPQTLTAAEQSIQGIRIKWQTIPQDEHHAADVVRSHRMNR